MMVAFLINICQSVAVFIIRPSDYLRAKVTREELMNKSDDVFVDIEVVELFTVCFVLLTCCASWSPVPQLSAEAVQKKVKCQSDVFFGVDIHD